MLKGLKLIFLSLILSLSANLFAQIGGGIISYGSWSYSVESLGNDEYNLVFNLSLEEGWHAYSQVPVTVGEGVYAAPPYPLVFAFNSGKYQKIGGVWEPSPEKFYDDFYKTDLLQFSHSVRFVQRIKATSETEVLIEGTLEGQACKDMCMQIDEEFSFTIPAAQNPVADQEEEETDTAVAVASTDTNSTLTTEPVAKYSVNNQDDDKKSLVTFFFIALIAGLLTLITPCVFPIIPMTVSFFMHGGDGPSSKSRKQATFYGLSIVFIYTIPIVILTLITAFLGSNVLSADFANTLSTHWIPNIIFTLIFLIFAASFFGMFDIKMPSKWVNKSDKRADKGGYGGAFFMAFTLVLVSFSCTGPILGTIIIQSLTGLSVEPGVHYSFSQLLISYGEPTVGMLGYSLGIAIPFVIFALFPSMLSKMPQSGGWLNSVKVVLGFVELALGLKFLSVSDQAYHWGLLNRPIYIAIWIVLFSLLGLYLLGKIRFPHDTKVEEIKFPRMIMAVAVLSFVVYLIPGMWGAPLKSFSGYMPPQHTNSFDINAIVREYNTDYSADDLCEVPLKYSEDISLPHGLPGYFDIEQALRCGAASGKPVFVDFTGHGCVNCREMEQRVWSNPKVLQMLEEEFVLVALYIDDKIQLPEEEWYVSDFDGKTKKTVGKKYADFEISKFNFNAQPYYVILDPAYETTMENVDPYLLAEPRSYDLDVDAFVEFLETGIKEHKLRYSGENTIPTENSNVNEDDSIE